MRPAVVAHAGKTLDGELSELRRLLAQEGFPDPLWFEVPKAGRAPAAVGAAIEEEVDRKVGYELDGGDGKKVTKFKVKIEPGAITVCVPAAGDGSKEL